MSNSKPEIVVIDRRGQNHGTVEIQTPKPPESEEVIKGKRTWKSEGFLIVMKQDQRGSVLISGRAVGLRGDGQLCIADYMFSPIWPEHEDWVKKARRRLNTFLGCDCKSNHPCNTHSVAMQSWTQEDLDRVGRANTQNMPEAVEVMMRAEQTRQKTGIVVPR